MIRLVCCVCAFLMLTSVATARDAAMRAPAFQRALQELYPGKVVAIEDDYDMKFTIGKGPKLVKARVEKPTKFSAGGKEYCFASVTVYIHLGPSGGFARGDDALYPELSSFVLVAEIRGNRLLSPKRITLEPRASITHINSARVGDFNNSGIPQLRVSTGSSYFFNDRWESMAVSRKHLYELPSCKLLFRRTTLQSLYSHRWKRRNRIGSSSMRFVDGEPGKPKSIEMKDRKTGKVQVFAFKDGRYDYPEDKPWERPAAPWDAEDNTIWLIDYAKALSFPNATIIVRRGRFGTVTTPYGVMKFELKNHCMYSIGKQRYVAATVVWKESQTTLEEIDDILQGMLRHKAGAVTADSKKKWAKAIRKPRARNFLFVGRLEGQTLAAPRRIDPAPRADYHFVKYLRVADVIKGGFLQAEIHLASGRFAKKPPGAVTLRRLVLYRLPEWEPIADVVVGRSVASGVGSLNLRTRYVDAGPGKPRDILVTDALTKRQVRRIPFRDGKYDSTQDETIWLIDYAKALRKFFPRTTITVRQGQLGTMKTSSGVMKFELRHHSMYSIGKHRYVAAVVMWKAPETKSRELNDMVAAMSKREGGVLSADWKKKWAKVIRKPYVQSVKNFLFVGRVTRRTLTELRRIDLAPRAHLPFVESLRIADVIGGGFLQAELHVFSTGLVEEPPGAVTFARLVLYRLPEWEPIADVPIGRSIISSVAPPGSHRREATYVDAGRGKPRDILVIDAITEQQIQRIPFKDGKYDGTPDKPWGPTDEERERKAASFELKLRVVDQDGKPIQGAEVSGSTYKDLRPARVQKFRGKTDRNGNFKQAALHVLTLKVSAKGFVSTKREVSFRKLPVGEMTITLERANSAPGGKRGD